MRILISGTRQSGFLSVGFPVNLETGYPKKTSPRSSGLRFELRLRCPWTRRDWPGQLSMGFRCPRSVHFGSHQAKLLTILNFGKFNACKQQIKKHQNSMVLRLNRLFFDETQLILAEIQGFWFGNGRQIHSRSSEGWKPRLEVLPFHSAG